MEQSKNTSRYSSAMNDSKTNVSNYLHHLFFSIFQTVDDKFNGKLNVLVHNASQIFVPEGDTRHPYEIGAPKDTNFGNLLNTNGM